MNRREDDEGKDWAVVLSPQKGMFFLFILIFYIDYCLRSWRDEKLIFSSHVKISFDEEGFYLPSSRILSIFMRRAFPRRRYFLHPSDATEKNFPLRCFACPLSLQ
jgi:hypothetical protein